MKIRLNHLRFIQNSSFSSFSVPFQHQAWFSAASLDAAPSKLWPPLKKFTPRIAVGIVRLSTMAFATAISGTL